METTATERTVKKAEAMIGKKYGRLTVVRYLGRVVTSKNQDRPRHMVECVCERGNTRIARYDEVLSGTRTECKQCAYMHRRRGVRRTTSTSLNGYRSTLCWDCANATNMHKCPWAGGKPREDWTAIPVRREEMMPTSNGEKHLHVVDTFCVVECPAFVRG